MEEPFRNYGLFENKKNEKILCLNVSRTYILCERPTLYECTRKYWRLNGAHAQNADLVFAICHGYIVGVFKPNRWYLSERYIGRWEFEGKQIEDSPYILMDISHLTGKRQNPVMYINM